MSHKKSPSDQNSDTGMIFLCLCFAILLLCKKASELKPIAISWMETHIWILGAFASLLGVFLVLLMRVAIKILMLRWEEARFWAAITAERPGSVFAGVTSTGERIYISLDARKMHTQVVGTTNAGKSESVTIPWAVSDMKNERGFVIVDGKAEKSFIHKIYGYAKKLNRAEDFKLFSLQSPELSQTFNPLLGGSPEEVAERVFNSFEIENEYYRGVQFEIFSQVLRIFDRAGMKPTFLRVYEAIKNPTHLHELAVKGKSDGLENWASGFKAMAPSDRDERTSGLLSSMSHFCFGAHARLFNTETPDIDIEQAMKKNQLVYFQLPVLKAAFLGKATGKLVLQCLQSAIANRHEAEGEDSKFFSIFLDDFTEYLYPGFVSILNKSRSANVGVVFAHQSLGDIRSLGEDVATSIQTCSNLKVVMRGNDPDSAEYFSKLIGTKESEQTTERADKGLFGKVRTGQGSIRDVEEFIVHPNIIKRSMGTGEALMIIPHEKGVKTVKLKLQMLPNLKEKPTLPIPESHPVLGCTIQKKADAGTSGTTWTATTLPVSVTQQAIQDVSQLNNITANQEKNPGVYQEKTHV